MKTSKTTPAATAKITSLNKVWGFYGTLQRNLKLSEAEAADAFDHAVRFTTQRMDMDLDAARRFLDSLLGRHIADKVHSVESMEAELGALYGLWKRDVTKFRSNAINTTDEDFYC
jgi:hypothetical protein